MPGKWGGAHRARPPRSANELGCQANGGVHAGRAPLDPPMVSMGKLIDTVVDESFMYAGETVNCCQHI